LDGWPARIRGALQAWLPLRLDRGPHLAALHLERSTEPESTDWCPGRVDRGVGADIHWMIAGGESGPGHRPVRPEWIRELRDACRAQGVPFFFKQWGGIRSKTGGRRLDGKLHSQLPRQTPRTLRAALA
jgi:hypothetical protein